MAPSCALLRDSDRKDQIRVESHLLVFQVYLHFQASSLFLHFSCASLQASQTFLSAWAWASYSLGA